MKKTPKQDLAIVAQGFDYSPLVEKDAERVQASAERIRERLKRTLEDIVEVGHELLAVKEVLEHGLFGQWLRLEFGWSERSAQNFMSVAAQFGPKSAIIADLQIAPTAAYLLAAPSVPEEARQTALERAEAGERITATVAKEIVTKARKKSRKAGKARSAEQLGDHLLKALERYRLQWNPKDLPDFARRLREFADQLESHRPGRKK